MKTLLQQVIEAVHEAELALGWEPRPFSQPGTNNTSRIIAEGSPYYRQTARWEPASIRVNS